MTKHKSAPHTNVQIRHTTLSPLEEKVVRMRFGLKAPASLALEHVAGDNQSLAAQLRAMEQRALAAVGARHSATKRKIVSALRKKD